MDIYGITGTNGKTTVTWTLARMLRAGGRRCGYLTTVEANTLGRRFSTGYTTPPLEALKGILAEMERNGADACTMEVSSHAIHQRRTGDTQFAGGGFTNLTEDHLDYHRTMAAYYRAKASFFERLAATNPGAPAAVCVNGAYGRRLARECARLGLDAVTCGVGRRADVAATEVEVSQSGSSFTLSAPRFGIDGARLSCPLAGRFNVENVTVAAALALAAGVPAAKVLSTVPRLGPRWGRLERVDCASPAAVYVDYAHTDDALANVLSTVRSFTPGRVWAVFGAGGDRDRMKRPKMGRAAELAADRLVVTSDNPRSEDPDAIIREILAGVSPAAIAAGRVEAVADRRAAICRALAQAEAGDSVVVCGKGHETTQTVGRRKFRFDDREVVRKFARS